MNILTYFSQKNIALWKGSIMNFSNRIYFLILIVLIYFSITVDAIANSEKNILIEAKKIVQTWEQYMGKPLDDDKEMTYDGLNYDVRKTNSLSAPYDLILSFYLNTQHSSLPIIVEYSRKEGVWDLKNVIAKDEHARKAVGYSIILNGLLTFESNSDRDSIKTRKKGDLSEDHLQQAKIKPVKIENGTWKVTKFETKVSGDAGASFDGENIKLILYKRPTENKHEIKIITQGEQSWSKVSNDINLIAFSYTRPDPLVAFSNYPFSQLTVWSNIKFDLRDKYKIGSVALKINKSDIQKLKQNKELYILGWSKTDNIEDKGYSFVFRIPLKGSHKTIDEALFSVSNAESISMKNESTTKTRQESWIWEEIVLHQEVVLHQGVLVDKNSIEKEGSKLKARYQIIYSTNPNSHLIGNEIIALFDVNKMLTRTLGGKTYKLDGIIETIKESSEFVSVKNDIFAENALKIVKDFSKYQNEVNFNGPCSMKILGLPNLLNTKTGNQLFIIGFGEMVPGNMKLCGPEPLSVFGFGDIDDFCRSSEQCDFVEQYAETLLKRKGVLEAKSYLARVQEAWRECDTKNTKNCKFLSQSFLNDHELK
jgi:hypothetical protein